MKIANKNQSNQDHWKIFSYYCILLLISMAVYNILRMIHAPMSEELSRVAYGVITGTPPWIAYQNRLLGPAIVYFISKYFTISYSQALQNFYFLTILAHSIVLSFLLQKVLKSYFLSLNLIILYYFSFICYQDSWYYAWDCLDLIVFSLFSWGIIQRKATRLFIILFFFELLNRESAVFISLYLIVDSFCLLSKCKIIIASKLKLITGLFLTLFCIIYTKCVRNLLFVKQLNGGTDEAHKIFGNHFYLNENLKNLFFENFFNLHIINSAFILFSSTYTLYSIWLIWHSHDSQIDKLDTSIKAALIYFTIVSCILLFGLINETRMYVMLFPFIIFALADKISFYNLRQKSN